MAKQFQIIALLMLVVQGSFGTLGACERILGDLKQERDRLDRMRIAARNSGDFDADKMLALERDKLMFKIEMSESINEGYDTLAAQHKTAQDKLTVLQEIENDQWDKCAQKAREKNPTADPLVVEPNKVILAIKEKRESINPDGRYGGQVCTQLITAYANLAEFAYIHLNEYPKNQELLQKRLDIFACGICQKEQWREEECAVIVGEANGMLKKALGIENGAAASQDKEVLESPEEMYTSVRDLCGNSRYIGWGNKSYILSTVARGLEAQCKLQADEDNDRADCCRGMANKLHEELFDK